MNKYFNGHYYEAVETNVTWSQALDQASRQSYRGLQGYLVTVTSSEENDFVHYSVVNTSAITGWGSFAGYQGTWIGGSDSEIEGVWRWMSGPEKGTVFANSSSAKNVSAAQGHFADFLSSVHEGSSRVNYDYAVSQVPAVGKTLPYGWVNELFWDDVPENIGSADVLEYGPAQYGVGNGYVIEYGGLPVSVRIVPSTVSVTEGNQLKIEFFTTNIEWGKTVDYLISGVSSADISGTALSGSLAVSEDGVNGKAVLNLDISADIVIDGDETLTVTAGGTSTSVQILDTSKPPSTTTYSISPSASSVNEGAIAKFTVSAEGTIAGTTVAYILSGLSAEDITGGEVSGSLVLDTLGMGTISVPIAADGKTEGSEPLTVTVGSTTSTITVNDTSKSTSQYYLSAADGIVEEGKIATFTISAEDAKPGTKIPYTISGSGITAKDIVNGKLSGSVAVGADNSATITIPIAADKLTEGDEDLTVTLTSLGVSETVTIEDTSTAPVAVPTYTLEASESSIKEGESAEFQLETTGVTPGTKLKYTITGVSNADLANKKLNGTVEVGGDGTATITIPTATDALTEGTETLTLSINGQRASVALLDDNSVKVSETVLEGSKITLYKSSLGGHALAAPGLKAGHALDDFVPLKASAIKDYALPKGLSAVLGYEDGSFGLIIKAGTGSKASFSEQKFSDDGIAKGKANKLSTAQVLAKETVSDTDINGDGVIGEVIVEVYDGDGDVNQQDYGLYKTSSGAVVLGAVDLAEGDTASTSVTLMASKTKGWVVPSGTSVVGIAITVGGSLEVLTLRSKQYSAQKFDAETGLIKGKATALKTAQIDAREYYYEIDLKGDGDINLVGQETMPSGWDV